MPRVGALTGFQALSRRRFFRVSLGVGVALGAGAGGVVSMRGCAPDVAGLRSLSAHGYRTLTALATALFPPGGAIPQGADAFDLARAFDTFLADEPEHHVRDLSRALLWLEYGPVFHDRRFKTFSHLREDERLAHFESWITAESPLRRQVALAFRKFLSLVFYDRAAVWPSLGYDGPLFGDRSSP
jgi:hypothetical protein